MCVFVSKRNLLNFYFTPLLLRQSKSYSNLKETRLKFRFLFYFPGGFFLLRFFFLCVSVVLVLSLFVPHLSFLCCLRRAMLRECGISCMSPLIIFVPMRIVSTLRFLTLILVDDYSRIFRMYIFIIFDTHFCY